MNKMCSPQHSKHVNQTKSFSVFTFGRACPASAIHSQVSICHLKCAELSRRDPKGYMLCLGPDVVCWVRARCSNFDITTLCRWSSCQAARDPQRNVFATQMTAAKLVTSRRQISNPRVVWQRGERESVVLSICTKCVLSAGNSLMSEGGRCVPAIYYTALTFLAPAL